MSRNSSKPQEEFKLVNSAESDLTISTGPGAALPPPPAEAPLALLPLPLFWLPLFLDPLPPLAVDRLVTLAAAEPGLLLLPPLLALPLLPAALPR